MSGIRILIVDDHPVVRAGVAGMIATQPDMVVIGEAGDGAAAVRLTQELDPDVVLMDLRMPGHHGLWAIERLKELGHAAQILVLTTYDTDAEVFKAIDAGAIGYLLKDSPRELLFEALRAAAMGRATLAPKIAQKLMQKVRSTGEETLTLREIQVLQWVARGYSNGAVAKQLRISAATVKSHLVHIYSKLGVSDRTAAVTKALEKGMISLAPPDAMGP